jgi:hypothetical protein
MVCLPWFAGCETAPNRVATGDGDDLPEQVTDFSTGGGSDRRRLGRLASGSRRIALGPATSSSTLMNEETRHIVFFVNWMAWREVRRGRSAAWLRAGNALRYYARAGRRLAGTVQRGQDANDGRDFSATQASIFLDGFTFRRFVEDCYLENARRLTAFDPALLRSRVLLALAGIALSGLRAWSFRGGAVER